MLNCYALIAFFLVGVLATEVEFIIRSLVFQSQLFQPFTAGKMYLFNGIISLILGFSFFQNKLKKSKADELINPIDSIVNVPVPACQGQGH